VKYPNHITCPSCNGQGGFEGDNVCGYSCDFCGGCFDGERCSECDGWGEVESEERTAA